MAHHKYHAVATAAFERYAERVSGQDLDAFFQAWLHEPGKPAATVENGFRAAASAGRTRGTG